MISWLINRIKRQDTLSKATPSHPLPPPPRLADKHFADLEALGWFVVKLDTHTHCIPPKHNPERYQPTGKPDLNCHATPRDFAVGDIVRLKSSGPKMTVNILAPENTHYLGLISCVWSDTGQTVHRDSFRSDILVFCTN